MFCRATEASTLLTQAPDAYRWNSLVLDELQDKAIPTEREAEHYLAALTAEAEAFRIAVCGSITKASLEAGQQLRQAVATLRQAKAHAAALAQVAATHRAGGDSNVAHTLQGIAILVIQAAEYVFMWTVLPMVIGVRQHSVEGMALAALAVAALLTLEFVFASLGIAKGHRVLEGARAGSPRRWAALVTGCGFVLALLLVLLLNLQLVDEVAVLREVGASLALSTDAGFQLDRPAMAWAMRVISIAVAVDGGILLVLFEAERQRRAFRRTLQAARQACLALGGQAREAMGQWRTFRRAEQGADAQANSASTTFMTEAKLRVQQALQRPVVAEPKTLEERVARLISHPVA